MSIDGRVYARLAIVRNNQQLNPVFSENICIGPG